MFTADLACLSQASLQQILYHVKTPLAALTFSSKLAQTGAALQDLLQLTFRHSLTDVIKIYV